MHWYRRIELSSTCPRTQQVKSAHDTVDHHRYGLPGNRLYAGGAFGQFAGRGNRWQTLAPAEQTLNIREFQFHIGRSSVIALARMGSGFHLS